MPNKLIEICRELGWENPPARFVFEPRPDQPDRYDQQTAYFECKSRGVIWLLGGNGAGTTELTMAKLADFLMTTPAPRPDTPFWIIAPSYDQCIKACWKEKLYGHGHILHDDIDWQRIGYYNARQNLPNFVPLLPDPSSPRTNWALEFKSWRQGRDQMQAQSIGGFAFVEQFPWEVFKEVERGCREYNFPGSKLVEYTPVEPGLSAEIEEMVLNGKRPAVGADPKKSYLPASWEVFHANTECAMEAGHVDKQWFEDFFGTIPEHMRDVRMKGLFASFEGLIYPQFNPFVHVVGDEVFERLDDARHRRGIDWGAGPQNPFACLWGAKQKNTQWVIYHEYYSNSQERTTVDHLEMVHSEMPWPDGSILHGRSYCDPSSADNIRIASKMPQYTEGRIPRIQLARGKNAVLEGVEHVARLWKPQIPVLHEDRIVMEPRLLIHESCVNLIRELKGYRWVQSPENGLSLNPMNPRREPLKKDDHACDALRYLTFTDDGEEGLTVESMKYRSPMDEQVSIRGQDRSWRDVVTTM